MCEPDAHVSTTATSPQVSWREGAQARGVTPGAACTVQQIADAEASLGHRLPPALSALYRLADGFFDEPGQWAVVWPLHRVVSENLQFRDGPLTLPSTLLAFGDDGTGSPFCLPVEERSPSAVVRWNWIDDEVEVEEGSLLVFMREWAGCQEWPPEDST